ncbi:MAG: PepSY domain-containing protein [Methylococcales bacterium]
MNYKIIIRACLLVTGLMSTTPLSAGVGSETPIIATLSLEQAARMVQGNAGGRVLGAETKIVEGRMVHVIKVLTSDGARVRNIQVDAESGRISGGR